MPVAKRGGRGKGSQRRAHTFLDVWCPTDKGEFQHMARISERTAMRMVQSGSAQWDKIGDGTIIGVIVNDMVMTQEMEADPGFRPRLIRRGGEDGIPEVWEVGYGPSMWVASQMVEAVLHDAMPGGTSQHQSLGFTPTPASAG